MSRVLPFLESDSFSVGIRTRSEEHTSELQSLRHLVCRLLLEKKKKIQNYIRQHSTTEGTGGTHYDTQLVQLEDMSQEREKIAKTTYVYRTSSSQNVEQSTHI